MKNFTSAILKETIMSDGSTVFDLSLSQDNNELLFALVGDKDTAATSARKIVAMIEAYSMDIIKRINF